MSGLEPATEIKWQVPSYSRKSVYFSLWSIHRICAHKSVHFFCTNSEVYVDLTCQIHLVLRHHNNRYQLSKFGNSFKLIFNPRIQPNPNHFIADISIQFIYCWIDLILGVVSQNNIESIIFLSILIWIMSDLLSRNVNQTIIIRQNEEFKLRSIKLFERFVITMIVNFDIS